MAKDKKPLPTPPNRKKRFGQEEEDARLLSDRMAMAQSQGKLDELLDEEVGDNEGARKLISMMMGMSGMDMSAAMPKGKPGGAEKKQDTANGTPEAPPEDVMRAVMSGDLSGLTQLLRRESEKRQGDAGDGKTKAPKQKPDEPEAGAPQAEPVFERGTIDQLVQIARQNDVSIDWLINRALTLYVRDHKTTGRL